MVFSHMGVFMSAPIDVTPEIIANPILKGIMNGVLRYTTDWFIRDTATIGGPVNIQLQRQVPVDKPGGGQDFTTVGIPSQVFRLTNQTISDGVVHSPNDDGIARRDEYILVGSWDADIQPNDTWEDHTGQWKVNGLLPNMGYESRASVTVFASKPDYGS
jgi:hypothetical protein